jgi:hypothetical protein
MIRIHQKLERVLMKPERELMIQIHQMMVLEEEHPPVVDYSYYYRCQM